MPVIFTHLTIFSGVFLHTGVMKTLGEGQGASNNILLGAKIPY